MTDYVGLATAGAKDLYELADLSADTAVVHGVIAQVYAAKSDAGRRASPRCCGPAWALLLLLPVGAEPADQAEVVEDLVGDLPAQLQDVLAEEQSASVLVQLLKDAWTGGRSPWPSGRVATLPTGTAKHYCRSAVIGPRPVPSL